MQQIQTSPVNVVFFDVIDDQNLSFYFDIDSKQLCKPEDPKCTVKLELEAYKLLLEGNSTFEKEASKGNLKISGDSLLLRNLGTSLRNTV